jgi:RNA polymerase sigma-70 factor, ECF subfamily
MNGMDAPGDAQAVARAREGDSEAFRGLVDRHSRALFHLAYRITGNEAEAEDVVQETFVRAWRALDRFEARAQVGSWLHRIAANAALDVVRARRRHGERAAGRPAGAGEEEQDPLERIASDLPSPERLAAGSEVSRRLRAAMAQLTASERTAFVLRHFEDQPIEEIGRALGLQGNAAKQTVFRAVRKLRRALEPLMSPVR